MDMDTKSNDDSAGSDSLDKSMQIKCVMVETTGSVSGEAGPSSSSSEELDNCSRDSAAESAEEVKLGTGLGPGKQADQKTEAGAGDSLNRETPPCNSSTTSTSCTAFETKVKLISQNLKETTLAETSASASASCSASASASASSSSSLLEPQSHNNSSTSTEDSASRVKKVRFHPDAKENDGGNWVKTKRRAAQTKRASSPSGMDLDGEADQQTEEYDEDEVEEEKFDLAKTVAEAEDYLKEHPLTFVNRALCESLPNGTQPCDGLMTVDQLSLDRDGTELRYYMEEPQNNDEDFYKRIKPENGIERVLGKETKAGKVQFLLRYENQGGLFWESEDFIKRMCPTLLKAYEKNRERRQQLLMHHVAKRQSVRQRYTDF
ncbi:uncharacterized protein Dana_GF15649 [Drosophila ananassae]|uniref:Chromo domain-containing protein n=1 Tax=Drosophila ananassae TaxID=7217 RepID=B3MNH2_DROAN|nr:pneumococcal serine-rich repeat protein [Drosophila ananassae]EDV32080.2 uncharacterized protein Dana_GF15649 [Drosophila ananassae]